MQRQAVPLLESERPLVGTGIRMARRQRLRRRHQVARRTGVVYLRRPPDLIRRDERRRRPPRVPTSWPKFQRSNQTTCYQPAPRSSTTASVWKPATVLADGPAIQNGDLALGKNLLIAFMPWNGYNYEDAVIISERLVQDDTLSSIHIEEYEIDARDTKLGAEEITRDMPNVGEDAAGQPRRARHHPHRRRGRGRRHPGRQGHPEGRDRADRRRSACCAPSSARRPARCVTPPCSVPHGETGTVIGVKEITREDAEEDGDELAQRRQPDRSASTSPSTARSR